MPHVSGQLRDVLHLAVKDYLHEWVMSVCFILALATVLAPLMVLFGLKHGIVSSLFEPLITDPRNREIRALGSGRFDAEWFAAMRDRDDVAFVLPRTRAIAATMKLQSPDANGGPILDVELIPSAAGDPMLTAAAEIPAGYGNIVLSANAAKKLRVGSGGMVVGSVGRIYRGVRERATVNLRVAAVAEAASFARDGAFVSLDLLRAVEDYRDGRAVAALQWGGAETVTQAAREFNGFRLYARDIGDVATLSSDLIAQGLDVRAKSAEIELARTLDRNLGIVYWVIAFVALAGYCLSFGASLWANVDRKRRDFSVLRLIGFRTRGIVFFPVVQAVLTAVSGWLLASTIYHLVERVVNVLFESSLAAGQSICVLLPIHFWVALVLTLITALLAAALSGLRISRMEPSSGLRSL